MRRRHWSGINAPKINLEAERRVLGENFLTLLFSGFLFLIVPFLFYLFFNFWFSEAFRYLLNESLVKVLTILAAFTIILYFITTLHAEKELKRIN
jgi:uncharacterized protein YqhQ